jgi:hypothetical protein
LATLEKKEESILPFDSFPLENLKAKKMLLHPYMLGIMLI